LVHPSQAARKSQRTAKLVQQQSELEEQMKRQVITLIEDNEGDIFLLRESMEEIRQDLELVAYNSLDHLVEYHAQIQDLVLNSIGITLLDLNIPGSSGWEILSWIKQDSVLRMQPVIVLTSSRSPNDIARAYQAGANAYIPKPDDFEGYRRMTQSLVEFWFRVSTIPQRSRS
jgi:CheY-like chemotaxis protein